MTAGVPDNFGETAGQAILNKARADMLALLAHESMTDEQKEEWIKDRLGQWEQTVQGIRWRNQ